MGRVNKILTSKAKNAIYNSFLKLNLVNYKIEVFLQSQN